MPGIMTSQTSSSSTSESDNDVRVTEHSRTKEKRNRKARSDKKRTSSSDSSASISEDSDSNGVALLETILNDRDTPKQEAPTSIAPDQREESKDLEVKVRSRPKSAANHSCGAGGENSPANGTQQHHRPKSAKYRSRRWQDASVQERRVVASSSASSLSAFDEDSTGKSETDYDQLNKQEQLEFRARQLRELLLHRYLDFRHTQSLNKHGKFFERHARGSQSLPLPPAPRGRRRNKQLEARAIYASRKPPKSQQTREDYEESIRTAARRLAEELIRAHKERQLEKDEIKIEKQMRPKSGRSKNVRKDDKSRGSGGTLEQKKSAEEAHKHVTVVAPCEEGEKSTGRSSQPNDEEKASSLEHKSILKQESVARTPKKPPRPYTAVMVSSHKRRSNGRGPKVAPGVYERKKSTEEEFTYAYLASLLNTLRFDDSAVTTSSELGREQSRGAPTRPKTATPLNRPSTARPGRRLRKPAREGEEESEKKQKNEKVNDGEGKSGRTEEDSDRGRRKDSGRAKSAPQIRPSTQPIKCNWDPSKSTEGQKPEIKHSDHQLKNTENPVIADWLKRKNALARKQRLYATRQNRRKRDILMQEYNEKEDKRELALVEYERWKKKKNKDILLRRRREIAVTNAQPEKPAPDLKPGTGTASSADQRDTKMTESNETSFSDLRSSSTNVAKPTATKSSLPSGKPRPKSAPTKVSFSTPEATFARKPSRSNANYIPVKFDLTNGGVEVLSHDDIRDAHLSAREPLTGNHNGPSENKTNNFMKDFIEVTSPKSMFDVPPPGTFKHDEDDEQKPPESKKRSSRDQYNNWVRQKAKERRSSAGKTFPSGRRSPGKPPPQHDPLTNELISDLAKRRIQKILDNKKEVDTGLGKNRPRSAAPQPEKSKSLDTENVRRWRLHDELGEDKPKSAASKTRKPGRSDTERPVFSYDRKTKSKSVFFERNPVVRRAVNPS